MHFKVTYVILLVLFTSCSSVGEFFDAKLIESGITHNISIHDIQKLQKQGYRFIMGYFSVLYEGKDITENCSLKFNSLNGPGVILGKLKKVIFATKENKNSIFRIRCANRKDNPYFSYTFMENVFQSNNKFSYAGEITFNFSNSKINDEFSRNKNVAPWIKSISYSYDEDLKKDIEKDYQVITEGHLKLINIDSRKN